MDAFTTPDSLDWLACTLRRHGVRHAAVLAAPGMHRLRTAFEAEGIACLPSPHAAAAGYAAQGLARASDTVAVCAIPASAAAELVGVLSDADALRLPMAALILGDDSDRERIGWLVDRVARIHFDIGEAAALAELLPESLRIARQCRGPVVVQLPPGLLDARGHGASPRPQAIRPTARQEA